MSIRYQLETDWAILNGNYAEVVWSVRKEKTNKQRRVIKVANELQTVNDVK